MHTTRGRAQEFFVGALISRRIHMGLKHLMRCMGNPTHEGFLSRGHCGIGHTHHQDVTANKAKPIV